MTTIDLVILHEYTVKQISWDCFQKTGCITALSVLGQIVSDDLSYCHGAAAGRPNTILTVFYTIDATVTIYRFQAYTEKVSVQIMT